MTGRMKAAAAVSFLVLAALVIVGRNTLSDPYASLVRDIVRMPQTYDGEHIDKLVALGSDGVRAIGSALLAGEEFPITFVWALERIGDERGVEPIVTFVVEQAPHSDVNRSTLTAASILALRGIGSAAACQPVAAILRDERAHPRVRLASASTCARLCSGDIEEDATRFILSAYENKARYMAEPNEGFLLEELYSALIDVDNDESSAILLDLLEDGAPLHIMQPVIGYLSRKDDENVTDRLERAFNDSSKHELPVRLAIGRAILDAGKPPTESFRARLDELVNEARPDVYGQAIANEAQQLKARAAER